jgi:hypothetical protein
MNEEADAFPIVFRFDLMSWYVDSLERPLQLDLRMDASLYHY